MNNENITYTIETVPTELNYNQFYAFNKRNCKIKIGEIIGTSAVTGYSFYKVGEKKYPLRQENGFGENRTRIVLEGRTVCYLNYQDLVSEYYAFVEGQEERKAKKAKTQVTKYCVVDSTFECFKTKTRPSNYLYRSFDTEEEATIYANDKIRERLKELHKHIVICTKLKNQLDMFKPPISMPVIQDLMVVPGIKTMNGNKVLNENDILVKFNTEQLKTLSIKTVDENSTVSVKEFLDKQFRVAKLSNGTLLIDNEYNLYNWFVKYENVDSLKKRFKIINLFNAKSSIVTTISSLTRAFKSYEAYIPFQQASRETTRNMYFNEDYVKKLEEDADTIIKMYYPDLKVTE